MGERAADDPAYDDGQDWDDLHGQKKVLRPERQTRWLAGSQVIGDIRELPAPRSGSRRWLRIAAAITLAIGVPALVIAALNTRSTPVLPPAAATSAPASRAVATATMTPRPATPTVAPTATPPPPTPTPPPVIGTNGPTAPLVVGN